MQKIIDQYQIQAWPQMTFGLTFLPNNYDKTKAYPLIIFLHGSGETGDDAAQTNNLLNTGLPQLLAGGMEIPFIVCCPQAPNASKWSYTYGHLKNILPSIQRKYFIDNNLIILTGLSAGGAGCWSAVTNDDDFTKQIAAIIPVSSVGCNAPDKEEPNLPRVTNPNGCAVWAICGAKDSHYSKDPIYINAINSSNPSVSAMSTGIKGADHEPAAWNTAYSLNWNTHPDNQLKINIYDWMLSHARNGSVPIPVPVPPPTKKLLYTITTKIYDDKTSDTIIT